jgi:hypothetical protein
LSDELSSTASRLVPIVMRKVTGMTVDREEVMRLLGNSFSRYYDELFDSMEFWITEVKGGLIYCRICKRGPFTRKGLYLHLTRIHEGDVKEIIKEKLRDLANRQFKA